MQTRRAPARPAVVLAAYALALCGPLGLGACRDATAPLPPGAVRFAPPPVYARWWALTEACAGAGGDFAAYAWYVAPGRSIPDGTYGDVAAYTDPVARRVVIASEWRNDGRTVRHEMLHALLGPTYTSGGPARVHPPAYFQGRCGGVVDCPAVGCADAGPAPVPAPADAPALPLSALDVRVDVVPNPVSRTAADHALSLVVRVRNPTAGPVWVPLDTTPDLSVSPRWVHWYGFRLVPAGQPVPVPVADLGRTDAAAMVTIDTARRVPFAAGQTRYWTVDLSAAQYAAGNYLAVGIFNTRQVWTPLAVTP